MTRVKRGVIAHKKRERLLRHVKGFKWGRKSKERQAREAILHKWTNQFTSRKLKKRDFRRLWNVQINAGARQNGLSYSVFIAALKKKHIELDRKILAALAEKHPEVFKKIVETAK
ncbi:MAG: 50S ribosomal protein L20 [Candidatus Sungbacteria bacterium]|nr:50S ribosomal protein L20 [Candidatus Sungbacteria bacterium]